MRPPLRFWNIHTEPLIDWDGKNPSPAFDKVVSDLLAILGSPEPVEEAKPIKVVEHVTQEETDDRFQNEHETKQIIHPALDVMVEVPAGEFIYQDSKAVIEKPFMIDVYPVTNQQFRQFMKEGGYHNI